ncbi:nucleotidyltransferase domain-containing protein [Roseococcus pinisoli]|uniref:Nucleotidyltransferase domain-containing protein n=1 Tax=Roseococcus pinisoli TaxID=2835040 RepID=A0ABS5Q7X3_9PROT|nr:nucleotidyltransferase domain-containing protein [Roseococcus pinisoli]MBS7809772.1 nucleotidyltransferase domain-containing protein [Roseococcus pinisoli]
MAVDADGFIPTLPDIAFQSEFRPLLNEARLRLAAEAGPLLHSLYVYGSVAEGRAVPYRSDLDLSLVVIRALSEAEAAKLDEIRAWLERAHPVATKVDFDIGTLDEVRSAEGKFSWGYWLKHHCQCLHGDDLRPEFSPFRPSREIAWAVNGNYRTVLSDYDARIRLAPTEEEAQRLQREAARKVIRSTNILRRDTDTDWPMTLEEHVARLTRRHPLMAAEAQFFLAQASLPAGPPSVFLTHLRRFVQWMSSESDPPA